MSVDAGSVEVVSVDAGSVEVVSDIAMANLFDVWAKNAEKEDGFAESLEFINVLQEAIDEGRAVRIGYSVIDKAVKEEVIKGLTDTVGKLDHDRKRPLRVGAIIIGSETRIDPDTEIGRAMIVNASLLSTRSNSRRVPTIVDGRSLVQFSTVTGSIVNASVVSDSTIVSSNISEGSDLSHCVLRESTLIDARLKNVSGSTGNTALKGDMGGMNLSRVGSLNNGRVLATPKPSRS